MILKILLIILYLFLIGTYTSMAIKSKSKLLWLCAGGWSICAVLDLCSLLARC